MDKQGDESNEKDVIYEGMGKSETQELVPE